MISQLNTHTLRITDHEKGKTKLKKLLLVLLAMMMLLNGLTALAYSNSKLGAFGVKEEDEANESAGQGNGIEWADFAPLVNMMGIEGGFYAYDDYNFRFWVPDAMSQSLMTQQQVDDGLIDLFTDADESYAITVQYASIGEDATLEDLKTVVDKLYEGASLTKINGIDALIYFHDGTMSVVTPGENGYFLSLNYNGVSDQGFLNVASVCMASLQRLED